MDEATASRFFSKIDKNGPKTKRLGRCWVWLDEPGRGGYCYFWHEGKKRLAHRFAYEYLVGPIPEGLIIDHVCHNEDEGCPGGDYDPHRRCVNPRHLITTDQLSNVMAGRGLAATNALKVECSKGHSLLDEENVYIYPGGRERACKECRRAAWRRLRNGGVDTESRANSEKTQCDQGHIFDEANTYLIRGGAGGRACKECRRTADRESKRKLRTEAKSAGLTVREYLASKRPA